MTLAAGFGLWQRLRRAWQDRRQTAAELREQLASVREQVLDEAAALAQDGDDLSARVRRNTRAGRGALGGERPL